MGNQTITVVAGDSGYLLSFLLQDSQGNIFDLSSITSLLFITQRVGSSDINSSGTMSITNPTAGTCSYTVASTDFVNAGLYNVQVQANSAGGPITWSNITLEVLPKIAY